MTGDTVVAPRIDRLARNLTEGLKTIEELHDKGINIRSLAERLDTGDDSPTSRLMLHMLLSLAEWERDTIRDRIRAGVDRAAAEGRTGGRTPDGRGERHRGSQQRAGALPATVQSTLPSSSAIPRTCIPASQPGAVPGNGSVPQAQQESGQGQHGEVPVAAGARNAPAMLGRLWRSWKDWTAGCRCGMKGASLLPRRRHPARYFSETATGVPHLFLSHPPAPTAWANAGHKGSGREGSRGHQWPRGHSRQAQSHLSAQADVP